MWRWTTRERLPTSTRSTTTNGLYGASFGLNDANQQTCGNRWRHAGVADDGAEENGDEHAERQTLAGARGDAVAIRPRGINPDRDVRRHADRAEHRHFALKERPIRHNHGSDPMQGRDHERCAGRVDQPTLQLRRTAANDERDRGKYEPRCRGV